MGSCMCKEDNEDRPLGANLRSIYSEPSHNRVSAYMLPEAHSRTSTSETINVVTDHLILNVLKVIGSIVDNDDDPPAALVELNKISDTEGGLIVIIKSLVRTIPMDNPLGALVIAILLDDCPLPSKDSIITIPYDFNLCAERAQNQKLFTREERNLLIVLGCIAEKMAGPGSIALLTEGTLDYLFVFLDSPFPNLVLFSLIALEKFAGTTENKSAIINRLSKASDNPILNLLRYVNHFDYTWRQVGFCAQWCLDNLFLIDGREFSYKSTDLSSINVMLNAQDVSQHLKISPDGLEARCDSHSFESVRCTFPISEGVWYYEAKVITPGVMQIGIATKKSNYLNFDGYGIGDDSDSIAYDGCRSLIWHNAHSVAQLRPPWKSGDVLGVLIDLEKSEIVFSINGDRLDPCHKTFLNLNIKKGFFAAASFMSFQQCRFNFGSEAFAFPPTDRIYKNFNDNALLPESGKVILPRHMYLEELRKTEAPENACAICYDSVDLVIIEPCLHRGFCDKCITLVNYCPLCRAEIYQTRMELEEIDFDVDFQSA